MPVALNLCSPSPLVCDGFADFWPALLSQDMLADIPSTKGNSVEEIASLLDLLSGRFWVRSRSPHIVRISNILCSHIKSTPPYPLQKKGEGIMSSSNYPKP